MTSSLFNQTIFFLISALEFFVIFCLIFTSFRLKLKHFVKELALAVLALTICSQALTLWLQVPGWLMIVIQLAVLVVLLKYITGENWLWSIWVGPAGYIGYSVIIAIISFISVSFGYTTLETMSDPFALKGKLIQLLSISVGLSISLFNKQTNAGFAFSFVRNARSRIVYYFVTTLLSFTILPFMLFVFDSISSVFSLVSLIVTVAGLTIAILYLSFKKDEEEFNTPIHTTISGKEDGTW